MITLEQLEELSFACKRIREIQEELKHVYNAVKSPSLTNTRQHNEPADPTVRAVHKAEKLHEELDRLLAIRMAFEEELEQIPDGELCAIIRWRFIIGLSWKMTSWKVYHVMDYSMARDKLRWGLLTPRRKEKRKRLEPDGAGELARNC